MNTYLIMWMAVAFFIMYVICHDIDAIAWQYHVPWSEAFDIYCYLVKERIREVFRRKR